MSTVPYLGCKISIVSKSDIRYEGILYTIDKKESTVALAKVRAFGTEDRPAERLVLPCDELYEYIIFRASDIKDLQVSEPAEQHSVLTSGLPHDPAIVRVFHSGPLTSCSVPHNQPLFGHVCGLQTFQHYPNQVAFQHVPSLFTTAAAAATSGSRSGSSSQTSLRNKSPTTDAGVQVSSGSGDKSELGSRGDFTYSAMRNEDPGQRRGQFRQQQRGRGGRRGRGRGRGGNVGSRSADPIKFEGEYDFEQANEEFKQLETKLANIKMDDSKTETDANNDTEDVAYDRQKSFFDNISCEASRIAKGIPRFNWRIERKINVETFGVAASNSWLRRRRGRGGFRRGFQRENGVVANTEVSKTVTFGANKVVVVESSADPSEIDSSAKGEEIPTIEIVVEKEKEWQDAKENWN